MANNRMYIRCNKCGQAQIISKYYPVQWSGVVDNLEERLNSFMEKHDQEFSDDWDEDEKKYGLGDGVGMYSLVTEMDKDVELIDHDQEKEITTIELKSDKGVANE